MIVEETRYSPFTHIGAHHHAAPTLSIVFAGGYIERFGTRAVDAGPLTAVYKPAQFAHQNEISAVGLHALFVELSDPLPLLPDPVLLRGARVAALVARARDETRDARDGDDGCMHSYMWELIAESVVRSRRETASPRARWLEQTRERLREEFRNPPALRLLADDAGVHPVHLSQSFRRRFGCTVGEYAREARLAYVAERLRGDDPIGQIAADAGFADHSHLNRLFRRATGLSPSEFRQLAG